MDQEELKYSNYHINTDVISDLTTYAFNNELFQLPLFSFESKIIQKLQEYKINCDLIDILFKPDNNGFCMFVYMLNEKNNTLFSSILDKNKDKLHQFIPKEWEFMVWVNQNECHNSFKDFYGKNAIDDIIGLKGNILYYSSHYFNRYYLENKLDYFYEIDNMKFFNNKMRKNIIHVLNFFESDTDGFKKFMLKNKSHNGLEHNVNNEFIFENLMFKHYSVRSLNEYISLSLPNDKVFDILIAKWGTNKASQVICDFINFQNEYILSFDDNNRHTIKFHEDDLKSLINAGANFTNCGKALTFGLKEKPDLLSYFIINDIITKDDLLVNMNDKELKSKAEHDLFNNTLDKKSELNIKRAKL